MCPPWVRSPLAYQTNGAAAYGQPPRKKSPRLVSVRRGPVRDCSRAARGRRRLPEEPTMYARSPSTPPGARPRWVLGLTSTAYFMVVLDALVVVTALPR